MVINIAKVSSTKTVSNFRYQHPWMYPCSVYSFVANIFSGISGEYLNLQWNSDGTKCPSTITPTLLYDKCWFCACDTCKETVFSFQKNRLDSTWFWTCKMWSSYWDRSKARYFISYRPVWKCRGKCWISPFVMFSVWCRCQGSRNVFDMNICIQHFESHFVTTHWSNWICKMFSLV